MRSPVGSVRFATEIDLARSLRRRLIPCFAMGHPGLACGRAAQAAAMTARLGSRAGTRPPSISSSTSTRSRGASRRTTAAHSTKGPVAIVTASPGCKSGGAGVLTPSVPVASRSAVTKSSGTACGRGPSARSRLTPKVPLIARHGSRPISSSTNRYCGKSGARPVSMRFGPPAGALHHRQPDPIPLARQVDLGSLLLMGPRMDHVPSVHRHSPFGSTSGAGVRATGSRTMHNKGGASTCRSATAPPTISAMAVR